MIIEKMMKEKLNNNKLNGHKKHVETKAQHSPTLKSLHVLMKQIYEWMNVVQIMMCSLCFPI
jgi:hypothetical protein